MIEKVLSDALSELDEKYISEALSYQKKPGKWVWICRYAAAAACLCVLILGSIGLPKVLPREEPAVESSAASEVIEEETSSAETMVPLTSMKYNITVSADGMYFTYPDCGFFLYQDGAVEKLSDTYGSITETTEGQLLFLDKSGEVSLISGTSLEKLSDIPKESSILDLIQHSLYYFSPDRSSLMMQDITTGEEKEILHLASGFLESGIIKNNRLYYTTFRETTCEIKSLDINTSIEKTLYSADSQGVRVFFQKDDLFISSKNGLQYMRYGDEKLQQLAEEILWEGDLQVHNGNVYFFKESEGNSSLYSINLETKKSETIEMIESADNQQHFYTEIVVQDDGYYYTDVTMEDSCLLYRSFRENTSTKIFSASDFLEKEG